MLAISLCLYALAIACWALDIRILWEALYLDLPRLLTSPPLRSSPDRSVGSDRNYASKIQFAQEILWVCVVSLVRPHKQDQEGR